MYKRQVKRGDVLLEIFAEKTYKLNRAVRLAKELDIIGIGREYEMVLAEFPEDEHEKYFIFDR